MRVGSLRDLRKNSDESECRWLVPKLTWNMRQFIQGMSDGVLLTFEFHSTYSGSGMIGYSGAMHDFLGTDFVCHLYELNLIKAKDQRYFLTPLGHRLAKHLFRLPYHKDVVEFLRPEQIFRGAKWISNRDVKEIAISVREEIADCVKTGILPAGKYSVSSSQKYYKRTRENHKSIRVRLRSSNCDDGFRNDVESVIEGLLAQYNAKVQGLLIADISTDFYLFD